MSKRPALSQSLRFEVFKRDNFTCQYCGAKAPESIIEVDHINPVSKGGDNSLLNLVTACKTCNRGKRDKKLSDVSEVEKQRRQLEEAQERLNLLDMIFKWKEGLRRMEEVAAEKLNEIFLKETGCYFSDYYKKQIITKMEKFGLQTIIDSLYIAINTYHDPNIILKKWFGIAYNIHREQTDPRSNSIVYIRNTLSRKASYFPIKDFHSRFPHWYVTELEPDFINIAASSDTIDEFFERIEDLCPKGE